MCIFRAGYIPHSVQLQQLPVLKNEFGDQNLCKLGDLTNLVKCNISISVNLKSNYLIGFPRKKILKLQKNRKIRQQKIREMFSERNIQISTI